MNADPAKQVSGARLGAAEDVEVGQAGQVPCRSGVCLKTRRLGLTGLPPTWVLHAPVIVRLGLCKE